MEGIDIEHIIQNFHKGRQITTSRLATFWLFEGKVVRHVSPNYLLFLTKVRKLILCLKDLPVLKQLKTGGLELFLEKLLFAVS